MARAAEQDWGFNDIARKFERDERPVRRPAGRRRAKPVIKTAHFGFWLSVIVIALIGLVALHVTLMGRNMEYNNLIQDNKKLEADNARLASEVSALGAPARIEKIAVEDLGMVAPREIEYVYVDPSNARQTYAALEQDDRAASGGSSVP
ncbi:MAG: cell division protein FtsL [Gaiellales bacterium]|nr:MAG: cell division protein FtsL [Gaiellales bacterium]